MLVWTALILGLLGGVDAFPQGRCYDRACNLSPYVLKAVKPSPVKSSGKSEAGQVCFRLEPQDCVPSKYGCCEKFKTAITKVVLNVRPQCRPSLSGAMVNGVKKAGGVFFDLYKNGTIAEIRVTGMNIGPKDSGTEICLLLKEPCPTLGHLCGGDTRCMYAFFDPLQHTCCPSCEITTSEECQCACPKPSNG